MFSRLHIKWFWVIWFLLVPVFTLSPWVAPYGTFEPFLLGLPFTLFWWIVLTLLLLVSLWFFVLLYWKVDEA
jgi:hypothetical protein